MERYLIKLDEPKKNTEDTLTSTTTVEFQEDPSSSKFHNRDNDKTRTENISATGKNQTNSSSSSEDDETQKQPSKKRFKRAQKFRNSWLTSYEWIESRENRAYCKVCLKSVSNNICHIERHAKSKNHKIAIESLKNQPEINSKKIEEFQSKIKKVKIAEIKLIIFLVLHNLPFTLIGPLIELIKSVAVDSSIVKELKCGRTKATEVVNNILCPEFAKEITEILRKQQFSLIIDETTDKSTKKCLVMVVRYFDYKCGRIRDRFLNLLELASSDAQSIYQGIIKFFNDYNIPIKNLIGFAADNAAVMMGCNKGVQSLLKKDNPHLYVIGCICHSMNLCASAACKKLPLELEYFARNIYTFFAYSSKRQKDFQQFQEYFDIKVHKILKYCTTRWLSFEQVVGRILEQWTPLVHFFLYNEFDDNTDLIQKIQSSMNNETKCYFYFLEYILKVTNRINLEFQSETPRVHVLLSRIKMFYKSILNNFIKMNSIDDNNLSRIDFDDLRIYKPVSDIYLGPGAERLIYQNNLKEGEILEIKRKCRSFYIVLCQEISNRIDFDDPVLKELQGINPANPVQSLIPLSTMFPNIICEIDTDTLEEEWRLCLLQDVVPKTLPLEDYWNQIFTIKNGLGQKMFPTLEKFITVLLYLPHSSASAERCFSQLNLIKTKIRNCLSVNTVNSIMLIKGTIDDEEFYKWVPSKNVISKYNK